MIAPRAAAVPIQVVALVLGIVGGMMLSFTVVVPLVIVLLTPVAALVAPSFVWIDLLVRFVCIVFCAYFLAAPANWRGLARRALLVFAVSLLGFAALGYLFAFAGLGMGGLPLEGPVVQLGVVILGVGAAVGYINLRDRSAQPSPASNTSPAPESPLSGTSTDTPS